MLGALQQIVTFSSQKSYFRVHVCGVIETQKRQANALRPNQKAESSKQSLPCEFSTELQRYGKKTKQTHPSGNSSLSLEQNRILHMGDKGKNQEQAKEESGKMLSSQLWYFSANQRLIPNSKYNLKRQKRD